jgi:hypothetical protein
MKQFILTLLVLLSVSFCQAQNQKVKPPKTTSTKPTGQTPPQAPTKPIQPELMEKKKDSVPKRLRPRTRDVMQRTTKSFNSRSAKTAPEHTKDSTHTSTTVQLFKDSTTNKVDSTRHIPKL